MLWFLTALELAEVSNINVEDLACLIGSTPRHCQSILAQLKGSRFSLVDEPSIRRSDWIITAPLISIEVKRSEFTWSTSPALIELAKPKKEGHRYAHLELLTLLHLTESRQEVMYRSLLAVAAEAKIWWSAGGRGNWKLDRDDAQQLFGTSVANVKHWRRYRFEPLKLALSKAGSRLNLEAFTCSRANTRQGKAADFVTLQFAVGVAPLSERPRSGKALARTKRRERLGFLQAVEYSGLGRVDARATARRHLEAVRAYQSRKKNVEDISADSKISSNSLDAAEVDPNNENFDEIFYLFQNQMEAEHDSQDIAQIEREIGKIAADGLLSLAPSDVLVLVMADIQHSVKHSRASAEKLREQSRIFDQLQVDGQSNEDFDAIKEEAEECFWKMHFARQVNEEAVRGAQIGASHRRYRDRGRASST